MAANIYEEHESEVRVYARKIPIVFDRAANAQLIASDGTAYVDFLSGCGSLNFGHNDPAMKDALVRYIMRDGIAHSLDLRTEARRAFIDAFAEIILRPRGLDYVMQFTGPTGTNAVEAALKLARKITGRSNVIAFTNGFHGVSIGSLAATGSQHHRQAAGMPLGCVTRFPYDGYMGSDFDTVPLIEKMLADPSSGVDKPAAFLLETIQGEGGLNVASRQWLKRIEELALQHGAMLIIDDIQAGCGRAGTFFSFEPAGIQPDIIVLAKSLSGFGLPLAMVLIRRDRDQWKPGEHNGTFRGNNHAFVTATQMLKTFWADDDFVASLSQKAEAFDLALIDLGRTTGWVPKGRGFMRGLKTPSACVASAVQERALEHGLILECCGPYDEDVKLMPPLTIETGTLAVGLQHLAKSAVDVAGK